ncbi:hypothetical protein D7Z94_11450 [Ulvibacterium marinum]|uniref:Uncharacterized protein n=1 Tax=Ulvibacterium marinum TaxID=2419782 RepID=A0A3B0C6T6_9FLAO|nr:hypothetical protein D7Z94_11450 [Ulvibacterium marinum]
MYLFFFASPKKERNLPAGRQETLGLFSVSRNRACFQDRTAQTAFVSQNALWTVSHFPIENTLISNETEK